MPQLVKTQGKVAVVALRVGVKRQRHTGFLKSGREKR